MTLSIENIKRIRPLQDRVLIERIEESENKTAGGIYIPDAARERAQVGVIVAVGNGKTLQSGNIQQLTVKVGDKVFFGKYAGTEISENFVIAREDEILGIL